MTGTEVDALRAAGAFLGGAATGGGGGGGGVAGFFTTGGLGFYISIRPNTDETTKKPTHFCWWW